MEWLGSNWIWIAIVVGFIALHWFGHGGHGSGHGHHSRRREQRDPDSPQSSRPEPPSVAGVTAHAGHTDAPTDQGKRHSHGC